MSFRAGFKSSKASDSANIYTAKCIDEYISITSSNDLIEHAERTGEDSTKEQQRPIDPRLQDIVERLFRRCFQEGDYKPAIGIAIEARRLDVVEEGIRQAGQKGEKAKAPNVEGVTKSVAVELMEYVLNIAMGVVQEISLRERVSALRLVIRNTSLADNVIVTTPSCPVVPRDAIPRLFLHWEVCHSS